MCLSNLPGLSNAESINSGRFVAAMTTTSDKSSKPSSSVSIWFTTRWLTPESSEPALFGTIASTSSKNTMQGDTCRAFLKISLTCFSDSPTHLLNTSGPFTEMKFASASVATALASIVLPVPDGPYNKIPRGARMPILLKTSGCFKGHSTASFNSCFAFSSPPTSIHFTFGLSMSTSLIALGRTIFRASLKSFFTTCSFSRCSFGILSSSLMLNSGRTRLNTDIAASLQSDSMSEPTNP